MSRSPQQLLLQLRALHERLARRDLGQAVNEAALAEALVLRSQRRLTGSLLPEHSTPEQYVASAAARNSLATLVVINRAHAASARTAVQAASEVWRSRERELEAAEHLVEAERLQRDEERRVAEQRETDDLSSARHGRDDGARA